MGTYTSLATLKARAWYRNEALLTWWSRLNVRLCVDGAQRANAEQRARLNALRATWEADAQGLFDDGCGVGVIAYLAHRAATLRRGSK